MGTPVLELNQQQMGNQIEGDQIEGDGIYCNKGAFALNWTLANGRSVKPTSK